MKRKYFLIILFLILEIFLSGCGTTPDNGEFIALVHELDTPQKIGTYMWLNFTYEYHPHGLLTPYQLYLYKKGDCNDFSNYGTYIAYCNGYEVWQIKIKFKYSNIDHCLGIYKEENYLTYTSNRSYCVNHYDNFIDIVNIYCLVEDKPWTKYIVYDYWNYIVEEIHND